MWRRQFVTWKVLIDYYHVILSLNIVHQTILGKFARPPLCNPVFFRGDPSPPIRDYVIYGWPLITTIIRIWGGRKPSEPGLPCHWEPGQEKLGSGRYLHDADATNDDESLMISMLKCMLIIMISPLPRGAPRPLDYLTTPTTQTIPYSSFRKLWRKEEDTFPQTIGICGRGSSAHIYCLLPKNEDKINDIYCCSLFLLQSK